MAWIEIEVFSLNPGVDPAAFREADASTQAFFHAHRPGLARRTAATFDNDWLIVTMWQTAADLDREVEEPPAVQAWRAMIDPKTVRRRRFKTLD